MYLLSCKSDALKAYVEYKAWLYMQYNMKVKHLHSNCGGEYLSKEFCNHLASHGTERRLTMHDTPQENGVAERLNRTLVERVQAMLHTAQLPKSLWGEVLMHTTWLKNRTSTKALVNTTPFEALTGTKPNLSELHEWGQKVSIHNPANSKLGSQVKDRRWVGFDPESKGLRVYWPDKITISTEQSIKFDTDYLLVLNADPPSSLPPSTTPSSTALPTQPDIATEDTPEMPTTEPVAGAPVPQGRGTRLKRPLQYI